MIRFALPFYLLLCISTLHAAIQTKVVEYRDGDVVLEGTLVWDDSVKKAPGVLIVHQWMGQTEYEVDRARQLAKEGFVAFALDIYGKGIRPKSTSEASLQAGIYIKPEPTNARGKR